MRLSIFRRLCQYAAVLTTNGYIATAVTSRLSSSPLKGVCVPVLNCYSCPAALFACPIGTIQHFVALHAFPFYAVASLGLVGLVVGRMSCGWLCPFGLVQDLLYKIKSPKFSVYSPLAYVKYLVLLVLVLALPYSTGELWFSKLCPAGTLTAAIPWALWNPADPVTGQMVLPAGPGKIFYLNVVILIIFLVWFVVSKRPFCKVFCPLGAILSLFNGLSLVNLEVTEACDQCSGCGPICPMDLDVHLECNGPECIRCLECTRCANVRVTVPFPGQQQMVEETE